MRKQKGFSLIELLIVVAIILIIAAIAVPSLLKARLAANDSAAASTMRTINTAEVTYSTTYPTHGYAETLSVLGGPAGTNTELHANMIDQAVGCAGGACPKGGHYFMLISAASKAPFGSYTSSASPITLGSTGNKVYCSTTDNVIRYDPTIPATSLGTTPMPDDGTCLKAPFIPIQ